MDSKAENNRPLPIQRIASAKRAILIPQKTNIRLDLESIVITNPSTDSRSRRPSLVKTPVVSASVSIDKSLSRSATNYHAPISARTTEDILPESKIAQFLEEVPTVGLTKEDNKIIRTRVLEEMYRIQQRQQMTPEERQRLYQLAISMDAPKLARKLVAEGKEATEEYSIASGGSDGSGHQTHNHRKQQPVSSFLTGEYTIPIYRPSPGRQSHLPLFDDDHTGTNSHSSANDDDLFCKAFDEVERIRQRMIQRVNTASVVPAAAASTQASPPPVHSARQPLTGRRLSGDGSQQKPRNPLPTTLETSMVLPSPRGDRTHAVNERRKSLSPIPSQASIKPASSGSRGNHHKSTTESNLHHKHSQILHDLLTPRTPERIGSHGQQHSHSGSSHQLLHHHPHNSLHSAMFTPSVDSEPSINVHEALDSILGSHSHSRSQSQPNSRSLSGRKKSALSSYHRILAAADAHSDDSPAHTSDDEDPRVHIDDDNDDNDDDDEDGNYAVLVYPHDKVVPTRSTAAAAGDDSDSEGEAGIAVIAATTSEDPLDQPVVHASAAKSRENSNNSSLDSESRRAVEGLRRYDGAPSAAPSLHSRHLQQQQQQQQQRVPPLSHLPTTTSGSSNSSRNITNSSETADSLSGRRPRSARLAPLKEQHPSSSTAAATATNTEMDDVSDIHASASHMSSLAQKRQLRSQQPPPPSASQKIPAAYLIASPLSDWIHASSGLLTPLPALTASVSSSFLHSETLKRKEGASASSLLSGAPAAIATDHPTAAASSTILPPTSSYTPVISGAAHTAPAASAGAQEERREGNARNAPLRLSRFTFTPQETTSTEDASDSSRQEEQQQEAAQMQPAQSMMLSSLELMNSTQHPDWHNLKRSLELLKEHVSMASSPLATPSHISLSGLTTPVNPSLSTYASQQTPYGGGYSTRAASTSSLLLQQSLKRPYPASAAAAAAAAAASASSSSSSTNTYVNNLANMLGSHTPHAPLTSTTAAAGSSLTSPRPLSSGGGGGGGGELPHGLGRKTSSFRHAGDLLLARNIVDAAAGPTTAHSPRTSIASQGIAQSISAVHATSSTNTSQSGMPPLRREGSARLLSANAILGSSSQSSSSKTNAVGTGNNRMFALAAALDAGDAVGKLMADMMMLGTPSSVSTTSSSLRLTNSPAVILADTPSFRAK